MDQAAPKRGKGRAMKVVLALSLAVNFVVLGLAAGAAWRFSGEDRDGRRGPPAVQSYGAPYIRALPREVRRELGRSLRRDAGLPDRSERRDQYARVIALLRDAQFDTQAVREIFEAQRLGADSLQTRAQDGWIALVAQMGQAERAAVADRLEEQLNRRGKKRDPDGPPDR